MKILHVLHTPRAEGTVRLALDWLSEPGLVQEVLILNPNPPELTELLRADSSWFQEFDGLPSGIGKFPWMVFRVWKVCRRRRPNLVICWVNGFAPWVLAGARIAGVRNLITHAGNPPAMTAKAKVQTVMSTGVVWLTGGRMVCCSRYVADRFARSPGSFASVLHVVYNCARLPSIRRAARESRALRRDWRPRLIMIATLEPHKDHETLLRAMPEILGAVPSAQLLLAGDGTLKGRLVGLSESLRLDDSVVFLGSRSDVPALLGQSDLFVLSTTLQEGLGTVLIEALAARIPIVASDVPACRELLEGRCETLVRPNDPSALAAAVIVRLRQVDGADLPDRGDLLEQFTPARMVAGYLKFVS